MSNSPTPMSSRMCSSPTAIAATPIQSQAGTRHVSAAQATLLLSVTTVSLPQEARGADPMRPGSLKNGYPFVHVASNDRPHLPR
jgi:hypothetical protein